MPDEGVGDLGARIEAEMAETGRDHVFPRDRVIGAHEQRLGAPSGVGSGALDDDQVQVADEALEGEEPTGPGSDVAPTARAAEREQERHRLERELGRIPAGEDGHVVERRAADVTREALDEAAAEADRHVAGRPLGRRPSGTSDEG